MVGAESDIVLFLCYYSSYRSLSYYISHLLVHGDVIRNYYRGRNKWYVKDYWKITPFVIYIWWFMVNMTRNIKKKLSLGRQSGALVGLGVFWGREQQPFGGGVITLRQTAPALGNSVIILGPIAAGRREDEPAVPRSVLNVCRCRFLIRLDVP